MEEWKNETLDVFRSNFVSRETDCSSALHRLAVVDVWLASLGNRGTLDCCV